MKVQTSRNSSRAKDHMQSSFQKEAPKISEFIRIKESRKLNISVFKNMLFYMYYLGKRNKFSEAGAERVLGVT